VSQLPRATVSASAGPASAVSASTGPASAGPARGGPDQRVVIALGSNLGDRLANLQQGLSELCGGGLDCEAVSAVFETAPVGGPAQDDFLNAVLLARTALTAEQVLRRCQHAEEQLGRVRTVRWGPRTLDVDIITYGTEVSDDPGLTLPHPAAHERAFVLAPWLDVDPAAWLPGHGLVRNVLAAVGDGGVRRVPQMRLVLPRGRAEEADISCR
jgi:2-amino-4-hydroxy-6-hydroxymethyldihydropteridine diphosphokinase